MAAPTISAVGEVLYDELAVTQPADAQLSWPLRLLVGALGRMLEPMFDLVSDTDAGPGWSALLDPSRCPAFALPWLAQFPGVRFTPGMTEQQMRDAITTPPPFERGSTDAQREAAQLTLTGNRIVFLLERDDGPFHETAITRPAETPDPTATEAALLSQTPAWIALTHVVTDLELWLEVDPATPTGDTMSTTITGDDLDTGTYIS